MLGHDKCEWKDVCFERFKLARFGVCAWVDGLAQSEEWVKRLEVVCYMCDRGLSLYDGFGCTCISS